MVLPLMLRVASLFTAAAAIVIGATVQGLPTRFGFFRWVARHKDTDRLVGWMPAFAEFNYTYDNFEEELSSESLKGQTAVVTGSNSGIGYWAALHLARKGAHVILACRNGRKCQEAAKKMRAYIAHQKVDGAEQDSNPSVECMALDTSSLKSVRAFAKEFGQTKKEGGALSTARPLHILLLNAGIAGDPANVNATSTDDLPLTFATNHVGHQLLYELLLPNLLHGAGAEKEPGTNNRLSSPVSRVVFTSSAAHYQATQVPLNLDDIRSTSSNLYQTYAQSKLANILCAKEASRQLDMRSTTGSGDPRASRIYVNSFHPGVVDTNIFEPVKTLLGDTWKGLVAGSVFAFIQRNKILWSPEEGALTLLYLAASPQITSPHVKGKYYHPQGVEATPSVKFIGEKPDQIQLQRAFWNFTRSLYSMSDVEMVD